MQPAPTPAPINKLRDGDVLQLGPSITRTPLPLLRAYPTARLA
jgi:hypothetical protein